MHFLVHGSHIFFISGWDSGRGLIISNWHGFQNEIFFWSSRHEISSDEQQSKLAHLSTVKQTDEPKGCVTEKKRTQLAAAGCGICRKNSINFGAAEWCMPSMPFQWALRKRVGSRNVNSPLSFDRFRAFRLRGAKAAEGWTIPSAKTKIKWGEGQLGKKLPATKRKK